MEQHKIHLIRDLVIIAFSIFTAVILVRSGLISQLLVSLGEFKIIGSFIAGLFFTFIFTVSISGAVLSQIAAESDSILIVAFFGGLGAVIGDLIIFNFVKDSLVEDIEFLLHKVKNESLLSVFHHKLLKWLIPFIGALIIASPLPDELGISLMGFARLKIALFIAISFLFNFLGILVIGLIAKSLL